jgi:hypothetical protein
MWWRNLDLAGKVGATPMFHVTEMEKSGECNHMRPTEEVSDTIRDTCLILYVDLELLQVDGPLLMAFILQFPLCLYELQRLVICVYDRLFPHNVMFPFMVGL